MIIRILLLVLFSIIHLDIFMCMCSHMLRPYIYTTWSCPYQLVTTGNLSCKAAVRFLSSFLPWWVYFSYNLALLNLRTPSTQCLYELRWVVPQMVTISTTGSVAQPYSKTLTFLQGNFSLCIYTNWRNCIMSQHCVYPPSRLINLLWPFWNGRSASFCHNSPRVWLETFTLSLKAILKSSCKMMK